MQINFLNKQNIFITKSNYLIQPKDNRPNSLSNDIFIKSNNISFAGLEASKILKKFKKIGITEYQKLKQDEIEAIRNSLSERILADREVIRIFSKMTKASLDREYPEGYVIGIIGRLPSIIGKNLELQGVDVKYCPISRIGRQLGNRIVDVCHIPTQKIMKYKDYLDSIGLSIEEVEKSKKTYIFTDHYDTGDSLRHFEQILKYPEIGIKSDNVQYKSINYDLILGGKTENLYKRVNIGENSYSLETLLGNYFDGITLTDYAHVPHLPVDKIGTIQKRVNNFACEDKVKQMHFALIDSLAQKGLLKS